MMQLHNYYSSTDPNQPHFALDVALGFTLRRNGYGDDDVAAWTKPRPYVPPKYDVLFSDDDGPVASMDRNGMLTLWGDHTPEDAAEIFFTVQKGNPYTLTVAPGMLLSILDLGPCGPLERAFWLRVGERLREQMREGGE